MNNYVQKGENITVAAPYDVASGKGALVGSLFGIAVADAASGDDVVLATTGVYEITALSTDTATVGAPAYWDNTNKRITTTATNNTKVGVFVSAKASGATTAQVRLNGAF